MELEYNGRVYDFDQQVVPVTKGYTYMTLTSEDNITCNITWLDGKVISIDEVY